MFKRSIKKRLIISSIALLILAITYFFPNNSNENIVNQNLTYVEPEQTTIYILNKDNLVSRTKTILKKDSDVLTNAKNVINSLIIDNSNTKYISSEFKPIIPKNTKILSLDVKDNILKINFNEEFLKIEKDKEVSMLESLIYSLTEISEIKGIMVFINNELLTNLPNSKVKLPDVLDRNYGINKIYELDNIKNTTKTTVYYLANDNNTNYYIPVTFISNDNDEKIEIIIKKLKSSPLNQTNLMSYLASSAELEEYEILESTINLSFNNYIFQEFENKNILEEVKYTIGLSIKDNYFIDNVVFYNNNEEICNFIINSIE